MFSKILVANRGEIACRVIRTAKSLGVSTVAIYSDADVNALHVEEADRAFSVGPAPAQQSYLDIKKIIAVAKQNAVEAIHPGYGFLSENAEFSRACEKNNIKFIGPSVDAIEAMGSKSQAKIIMEKAKVPLIPGYQGQNQAAGHLKSEAGKINYPLLIKASAGGGGKGMRLVEKEEEFDQALISAKREAKQSFGDDIVILEKYMINARHVEVQIFCDQHGNGLYLGDRDCSMQRRHQKIIEEAPAPGLSDKLRQTMGEAAVRAALAINYEGAGTIEFLLDQNDQFYFMEMNTRLQVEHPVTEMTSGIDLVEWQLRVATGEKLPLSQQQLQFKGHAIEARLYAEDSDNDFMPCSGEIEFLRWPKKRECLRIDSGIRQGDVISSHYDPMLAKIIVWGENRQQALKLLDRSLQQCCITGLKTNLPFLSRLLVSTEFTRADLSTSFVDNNLVELKKPVDGNNDFVIALFALAIVLKQKQSESLASQSESPWLIADNWRANQDAVQKLQLVFNQEIVLAEILNKPNGYKITAGEKAFNLDGRLADEGLRWNTSESQGLCQIVYTASGVVLFVGNSAQHISYYQRLVDNDNHAGTESTICAPMHGHLIELLVKTGQTVEKGEAVAVLEAMKMEHTLRAPISGKASKINYRINDLVEQGAVLIEIDTGIDTEVDSTKL